MFSATRGDKNIRDPATTLKLNRFGVSIKVSRADELYLHEEIGFSTKDIGLKIPTDKGGINLVFHSLRFRSSDMPVLLCDRHKAKSSRGLTVSHAVKDITRDQLNYFDSLEWRL